MSEKNPSGRIEYAARNIIFGLIGNVVTLLLGFVSRTVFIHTLGITYLGVNGLYTNVLSVLSLAELGIGTAMNYSLYKPVALQDFHKIKLLMKLYRKAYRYIAVLVAVLGLLMVPLLSFIIKDPGKLTQHELIQYYLIFLFNTVSTYFVSYKFSLVNAEQKNYIQTNIQWITSLVILIAQIIVLVVFHNFLFYLLIAAIIGLVQKIGISIYLNHRYPYLHTKEEGSLPSEELVAIKKNMIALLFHKIGDISIHQTGNIMISTFINVTAVGLLSNYNLITTSVMGFIQIVFFSVVSGFGNLIATETIERQYFLFRVYRFLAFWIYGLAMICLYFLLTPFITLWIGKDMIINSTVILFIALDYYCKGHRIVIYNFKTAAGIFDADKYIAMIQGAANLIVSVILVHFLGMEGVFIGAFLAGLIANGTKPFIVYRLIFHKRAIAYYVDSLRFASVLGVLFCFLLLLRNSAFTKLSVMRFILFFFLIFIITNGIFYVAFGRREEFLYLKEILLARIPYQRERREDGKERRIKKWLDGRVLWFQTLWLRLVKEGILNMKIYHIRKVPIKHKDNNSETTDTMNGMKKLGEEKRKKDITPKDIVNDDVAEELTEIYHKLLNHTRESLSAYPKSKKYHMKEYISSMLTNRTIPYVDRFFWPNGLLVIALEHSFQVSKNHQDFYCMVDYYNRWFASGMKLRHLDYGINGYSLILIHQLTKDDKYKKMIDRMVHYLYNHPKDEYGSLPYRITRSKDIYIDSIGMICPFLCRYGSVYHDPNATQLAIKQISNFLKFGFDSKTGLPYHGYNRKERLKYGIIGWGRALGWLLIGLADSLPYITSNHPKYEYLCESFIRIVETTTKFQKSSGYYSWQLTAMEGHIDTSATAMISYAIKRGVSIGILDKLYLYHAMLGLGALERSIVNGEVTNASQECMGFGMYPQNYGKYPWAQGPTTALIALSLEEILKKDEEEKS